MFCLNAINKGSYIIRSYKELLFSEKDDLNNPNYSIGFEQYQLLEVIPVVLLFKREILGANPQMVRELVAEIMSCINAWHHLEEEEDYEFRLIINELIVNGIVHGNKCFDDKLLTIIIHALDDNTISICIRDQGMGFDYRKIEKGVFPCDSFLLLERGRGLKIVQSICDDITFSKNGSWISVKKSIKS